MEHKNCTKAQLKSTRFQACVDVWHLCHYKSTQVVHSLKCQKNYHNIDFFTHLNSFILSFELLFCRFSTTKSMKSSKIQYFGVINVFDLRIFQSSIT